MNVLDIFHPLYTKEWNKAHLWGGRGRGGSYAGTQYYLHELLYSKYFRGFMMRSVSSDIRTSLWADLIDRIEEYEDIHKVSLSKQLRILDNRMEVYHANGNRILSKGFKSSSSTRTANLKSIAGATHVMIEEGEEVFSKERNKLLDSLRTVKVANTQIIEIFNPPDKHHPLWEDYNLLPSKHDGYLTATPKKQEGFLSIFGTYEDNFNNINKATRIRYEKYKDTDPVHYYTNIKGLIGTGKVGSIYKNINLISVKDYEDLELTLFYGLDFGSSNPTALVEVKTDGDNIYIREKLYKAGNDINLLNEMEANIRKKDVDYIVCDTNEPETAMYLWQNGFQCVKARKGKGSVNAGIKLLQSKVLYICEDSVNARYEFPNYRWKLDRYDKPTDEPVKENDHLCDAVRMVISYFKGQYGI